MMHPENKEALFNWLDKPVKNKNTHEKADRLVNLIKLVYTNKDYLVKTRPKTHDGGIDLEVYDKNVKIYGLFQAKNLNKRLSDDEVNDIIQKIDNNYKNKGNSKNIPILIFSTQGFTNDGKNFKCNDLPNIKLLNFDDFHAYLSSIAGLKAEILNTLKHYQIDDYVKSITILKNYKKLYLNLPPSYGKSFIIKTIIQNQFHAKKILWLTPSKEIMKNILKNTKLPVTDNITSLTYTKLVADIKKGIMPGANLIVLDELHRTGAFTFEPAVETLIKNNPNASIIGASASNERSDGTQMIKELLPEIDDTEKITIRRDLTDCFKEDIIQIPNYVLRGYNIVLTEELNELEKNVPESKKDDFNKEKKKLIADWDEGNNLDDIVAEDFKQTHECKKGLIFCESIEKLNQQKDGLSRAFRKINKKPPKIYTYVSETDDIGLTSQEMKQQFENFQEASSKNYHLLFSVNKLNEGLHLNDLDFVVFLRKTQSEILTLQQLGRILKPVNDSQKEIWVYDYAANLNRTKVIYFKKIHAYKAKQNAYREKYGYEKVKMPVLIEDPIFVETEKLLKIVKFKFSTWMENFNKTKKHKTEHGFFPPQSMDILGTWCQTQRDKFKSYVINPEKRGKLNNTDLSRLELLESINFDFFPLDDLETNWEKTLSQYEKFIKQNKRAPKINNKNKQENSLANWAQNQRQNKRKGLLSTKRITTLDRINFDWGKSNKEREKKWDENFKEVKVYYKKYGKWPDKGKKSNNPRLGAWCKFIKGKYHNNTLDQTKLKKLTEIGFDFGKSREDQEKEWQIKFKILKEYVKKHNEMPKRGHLLDRWCHTQRQAFKGKKGFNFTSDKIKQLDSIGFNWETRETEWYIKYNQLEIFIKDNGREPQGKDTFVSWVQVQRTQYKKGKLSQKKINLLKKIGLDVTKKREFYNNSWNNYYFLLKEYIKDKDFPRNRTEFKGEKLGGWCSRQRQLKKQNKLSKERIQKLNEIKFPWELRKVEVNQEK